MENKKIKLHLGAGEKYLEGYWNIDFPPSEHSVMRPRVDEYADITKLSYPDGSIEEIRTHHMFEHFTRAEALALLARWRRWLKPGGLLTIETPDFTTSAYYFLYARSLRRRFQLARHMVGSEEAGWALHKDYWDKQKFEFVLSRFGFKDIKVREHHNGLAGHGHELPGRAGKLVGKIPELIRRPLLNIGGNLLPGSFYEKYGSNKMPNVIATARKDGDVRIDQIRADEVAREILAMSLAGREGADLLKVWFDDYKKF